MITIIKTVLFIAVLSFVYVLILKTRDIKTLKYFEQKIKEEKQKYNKKIFEKKYYIKKKISIREKFFNLIIKSGLTENKLFWWLIPETLFLICIITFILSYILFLPILKIDYLTAVFCISIALIPIFLILVLTDINEEKIEKNLLSYIIQLKNQTKITVDIIEIFKNTIVFAPTPLNTYVSIFLLEMNSGVNALDCFENLKDKINLERFKQLITNIENCYFNGGNILGLFEKTQYVLLKVQEERNKRNEQTMSARIVLGMLIVMSLFVYFKFVNFNEENFEIMSGSIVGKAILVLNFVSIWFMMFLIIYVKKVDE